MNAIQVFKFRTKLAYFVPAYAMALRQPENKGDILHLACCRRMTGICQKPKIIKIFLYGLIFFSNSCISKGKGE